MEQPQPIIEENVLEKNASKTLKFLLLIGRLKRLKRTGWIHNNVSKPESVAEHMYRMAMATFLVPSHINSTKCMKMALVHDLGESIVGDITPHCGVSKEKKFELEKEAIETVVSYIDDATTADEIKALWEEYEAGLTAEAKYVQDIDKFEMILQALEYEQDQDLDLSSFFKSTENFFKTKEFQDLDTEVRELHKRRHF